MSDIERVSAYNSPFFTDDESVMRNAARQILGESGLSEEDSQLLEEFAVTVGKTGMAGFFELIGESGEIDVRLSTQEVLRYKFSPDASIQN